MVKDFLTGLLILLIAAAVVGFISLIVYYPLFGLIIFIVLSLTLIGHSIRN